MCGLGHGMMAARIIVETPQDHAAWLQRNTNPEMAEKQQGATPALSPGDGLAVAEVRR
jgi:heme/copper-type cytochrome/quinol oxidase subunit 2